MPITLVIHGGAGNITPAMMDKQQEAEYDAGLKAALDAGYDVL
ncbi:MAG: Asparaginase, partial [Flavipsychrobacter sp.]|nr:Asparaginase [Flavipsychrobacter sp.]